MLELIRENSYRVVNNKNEPTHFNAKILKTGSPDLILIKKDMRSMVLKCKIGEDINSDHLPICLTLTNVKYYYNEHRTQHWIFRKCEQDKFKEGIVKESKNLLKHIVKNEKDLNNFYGKLINIILNNAKKCCPKTRNKSHIRSNPWWNEECKKATLDKIRMRRQLMKEPDKLFEIYYKRQVKITRGIIRRAKKQYFEKLVQEKNINDIFKIIKNLSKPKCKAIEVIDRKNGKLKNEEAANSICEFFANVGSKYSTKRRSQRQKTKVKNSCNSLLHQYNKIINKPFNKHAISEIVNKLNLKKAAGRDGISPFMLKMGGDAVILLLEKLFNICLELGKTPDIWNKGLIIPIQKIEGMIVNIDKFRPICLLSVIGKIFERLINSRISNMSSKLFWLPRFQAGFVKNKSTLNNLVELQQEIHNSFSNNEYMVAIFLDIKKAYDSVNRIKLMEIIEQAGIEGNILKYIKFFLSNNRRNKVCFNKYYSLDKEYPKGVPQGSPLSPLLFNLYMRDISMIVNENILQFADDIVIWTKNKDLLKAVRKMEKILKDLKNWLDFKELSLAPAKCVPIIFTRKRKYNKDIKIKVGGKSLEFQDKAKYLGLIFDKNLTWKYHVKDILPKCEKRLGVLKYVCWKYKLKQNIALNLYKAIVRPIMEYGVEVWGDTSFTNLKKLDSIEHRSITTALGVNKIAKKSETTLEAKIVPLSIRRKRKLITTFQRNSENELGNFLIKNKRFKKFSKCRSTYGQRLIETMNEFKLKIETVKRVSKSDIHSLMIEHWEATIKELRKPEKVYQEIKLRRKYQQFTNNRNKQAAWHQARLGVIPTKEFLYRIKFEKTNKCSYDNKIETQKHFILKCKGYKQIWNRQYPKRNTLKGNTHLKVLLNEDKPPPEKRKISNCLLASINIKRCKITQCKENKKK